MHELLILRHAKSSWKAPGLEDHDRPLAPRGRRDAPRMGRLLRDEGIVPDLVLCSSARRARKTWKRVRRGGGLEGIAAEIEPRLYHAEADEILALVAGLPEAVRRVLLVGHNPGLEELLARLAGDDVAFPTAALARLGFPTGWSSTEGVRLLAVWRPRELG